MFHRAGSNPVFLTLTTGSAEASRFRRYPVGVEASVFR
jgi:hypothetical protein